MSLVSVMKLLGHHSYRMTLRYAAVTQETIEKEYRKALKEIKNRYDDTLPKRAYRRPPVNPIKMLSDINRWLKSNSPKHPNARHAVDLLIKRINRLKLDISKLRRS